MKAIIGVSNRHVHLCEEDIKILFGDIVIEKTKDLLQINEFATNQTVTIKTEKSELEKVRVLGTNPTRGYTQAEISKTDSFKLGINPPVRNSGDLREAETVTIVGPKGEITKPCCIIANRHLHVNKQIREELGLTGIEKVSLEVASEKRTVFYDVYVKETKLGVLEFHIDTDDANGCLAKTGEYAEII